MRRMGQVSNLPVGSRIPMIACTVRPDGPIESGDDMLCKQIQTPNPTISVVPIVSDQDQSSESADFLTKFKEPSGDRIRVAGDNHLVHEITQVAFIIAHFGIGFPWFQPGW